MSALFQEVVTIYSKKIKLFSGEKCVNLKQDGCLLNKMRNLFRATVFLTHAVAMRKCSTNMNFSLNLSKNYSVLVDRLVLQCIGR